MFQRKLIAVLSVLTVLAFTAGSGHASLSRVEGMGLQVPALSQFTDDYANIYYYPSSVVRQNNLVLAEVGNNSGGFVNSVSTDDQSFTLIRNHPRLGAIAFQMKQNSQNLFNGSSNSTNEQWDVIWGKAFTKMDFAVRVDIANSYLETETTSAGTTVSSSWRGAFNFFGPGVFPTVGGPDIDLVLDNVEINTFGITPAISLHMENDNRLDVAGTYRKYTFENMATAAGGFSETFQDAGNASYAFIARMAMNRDDNSTWYPAAFYISDDFSWEYSDNAATPTQLSADETYKVYGAGISNNMRVNDNNLLISGVLVAQAKQKYERGDNTDAGVAGVTNTYELKQTVAPWFFAALETEATSWLKVRIGASKAMFTSREEETDFSATPVTDVFKARTSEFEFSLGTGIRWNNLDIDMTLNDQFPLSGGYILSGNEATPFNRVSATYHF